MASRCGICVYSPEVAPVERKSTPPPGMWGRPGRTVTPFSCSKEIFEQPKTCGIPSTPPLKETACPPLNTTASPNACLKEPQVGFTLWPAVPLCTPPGGPGFDRNPGPYPGGGADRLRDSVPGPPFYPKMTWWSSSPSLGRPPTAWLSCGWPNSRGVPTLWRGQRGRLHHRPEADYVSTPTRPGDRRSQRKAYSVQVSVMYTCWPSPWLALPAPWEEEIRAKVEELLQTVGKTRPGCWNRTVQSPPSRGVSRRVGEHLFSLGRGLDWALSQEGAR